MEIKMDVRSKGGRGRGKKHPHRTTDHGDRANTLLDDVLKGEAKFERVGL
jgi:hypothetical protein